MKNKSSKNTGRRQGAARRFVSTQRGLTATPLAVVTHVLETLPDSLSRRQELLAALALCVPPDEENSLRVRTLQFHLEEHQRLILSDGSDGLV